MEQFEKTKFVEVSIDEINRMFGVSKESAFWAAIVGWLGYPQLTYDPISMIIRFPDYVPLFELAKAWIQGTEEGIYHVGACRRCGIYYDLDQDKGVYCGPDESDGYLCSQCADRMTARDYYRRFVRRREEKRAVAGS